MKKRAYHGESDLRLLQKFNAEAIARTDHCGYLHPGDIPHRIYNANRYYDPADLVTIWEDTRGAAAWLFVSIGYQGFDAQVRLDLRGSELEIDVLELAYERTKERIRRQGLERDQVFADAFQGDTVRIKLLEALGWEPIGGLPYALNRVRIEPIALPDLPAGFSYRSARGVEDAAALAEVHAASFNSSWTPALYRSVMRSPGYDPKRELVIQAPDGSFAAFSIIWFDHLNRTGLFEPVGTHKDYLRRGFARAIILYGLQQMAAAGMANATVGNFGDNEAAKGLYQDLGFRPWHLLDAYTRAVTK